MVSVGGLEGMMGGGGLGLEAIGMAGSIFSGIQESGIESKIAGEERSQAVNEEQITQLHQQQMHMFGQRQAMENYRKTQQVMAQGKAAAVNQGAQFGSGLAGAQGAESAEGGQGVRNLNQNMEVGDKIFGLTYQIDQSKMQEANLGSSLAKWQGISSMFQGLSGMGQGTLQAAGPLSKMFGS